MGSGFPYCGYWEDKERRPKTGDRRPERQGTEKMVNGVTGSGFPYCGCWEDKERRPKTGDRRPERQGTEKMVNGVRLSLLSF